MNVGAPGRHQLTEDLVEAVKQVRDAHCAGGWDPSDVDAFFEREEAIESLLRCLARLEQYSPPRSGAEIKLGDKVRLRDAVLPRYQRGMVVAEFGDGPDPESPRRFRVRFGHGRYLEAYIQDFEFVEAGPLGDRCAAEMEEALLPLRVPRTVRRR